MEADKYFAMHESMLILKARERLSNMEAAAYPHLTEKERSKEHRRWHRASYPDQEEKVASLDEAFAIFKRF